MLNPIIANLAAEKKSDNTGCSNCGTCDPGPGKCPAPKPISCYNGCKSCTIQNDVSCGK
jgi:hypothetical protein